VVAVLPRRREAQPSGISNGAHHDPDGFPTSEWPKFYRKLY
jgi:hypothetical protein